MNARAIAPEGTLAWTDGFDGIFPDALVYGQNHIAQTFTLTNNGVGPLSLASVTIDDETSYELIFDDLSDLAQGASRSGEVRFLPTLEGTNNSDLAIYFEVAYLLPLYRLQAMVW